MRCYNFDVLLKLIAFFSFFHYFQSFIWPLARSANEDEPLVVELRTQTTKTLIKTGLSHASGGLMGGSTATGTITSSSKCIGQYMMLMQGKYSHSILWIFASLCQQFIAIYSLICNCSCCWFCRCLIFGTILPFEWNRF